MFYRPKKKQLQKLISDSVSVSRNNGKEVCGLIVDTGYFLELIQVKNKIKRGGSFKFYVDEVNKIESAVSLLSYKIVATFHSHPYYYAKPGESDLAAAEDGELMLIIDCLDKVAMLWIVKNKSAKKVEFKLI
jgi:proteasome lid subunit RPN8/RPN11